MSDVERREFTCVRCPMGCSLTVSLDDGVVTDVTGNGCPRGHAYGEHEATHPERVVTSLVRVAGDFRPVSVKTVSPVPKECVADVLAAVAATTVEPPVSIGDVLVPDVCGTGVDVVATRASA
ncbi:MAG: DUF1667 domain-containing protein [Atopobiaceae bacterium]|jgi:CxxC motif-containing protein|nr:DUF1667 domain-containing protein [Atopobiaceae bacterium]MCI2172847.1 DUF1667 domain-containing protein [Atopobiaceae bacterium]MCI2207154.1 DUF1667 domain-containing protein [Atopobiaceae bacterium]